MSLVSEIKWKVMTSSREDKLRHFNSLFKDGQSVLDVGVSPESTKGPAARNYFLKHYPYDPGTYTGLGIQDLSGMEVLFPGKRFVQYAGGRFPFSNKTFDWVFSNAVIEHVGDENAQLLFLNEMMRVAKRVFFTTPNKYFPFESHTDAFLLHWHDDLFYEWCSKNKPWVKKNTLRLLSFDHLRKLLTDSDAACFSIRKNRVMGISMTFTVVCES